MKIVVVASTNPVKVEVAKRAFAAVFPDEEFEFISLKSDSGVPDQPMDDETRQGAQNRLAFVRKHHPDADFWISQESGLFHEGKRLANRAWVVALDKRGFIAESSTSSFYLPNEVSRYIREGLELSDANDKFFGLVNSKHGIGALTDGLVDRVEYYLQPAIIALSELKHQEWYS